MQILLGEQEYDKLKNDLKFYKDDYSKMSERFKNDITRAIQVTANEDYLKREFEINDVEIDIDELINVALEYGFGHEYKQMIKAFLDKKGNK